MVRGGARLNADKAGRKLLEDGQNLPSLQLPAKDHVALRVNAVNLKHRLCDIHSDYRNLSHGRLLTWHLSATMWLLLKPPRSKKSRPRHQKQKFDRAVPLSIASVLRRCARPSGFTLEGQLAGGR